MAAPNVYAVPSYELLISLEATRGTAAASNYQSMKVKNPKWKPELSLLEDATLQGSMVRIYDLIPSLRYDSHGWDSYPYLDAFPVMVAAELGSSDTVTAAPASTTLAAQGTAGSSTIQTNATIAANSYIVIGSGATVESHKTTAVAGTSAPFTVTLQYPLLYTQASATAVTGLTGHTFSLLNNSASTGNQPLSCTIKDFDGEEWRQWTAAQLDKLTIKGTANGLVDYTCSWFANAFTTPGAPSPSFTSVRALPGWTTQIAVAGTQINQYWVSWEVDPTRGVKTIAALTGTQAYLRYFADAIDVPGKITVIEQSAAPELTQYLNGTQQSLDITTFDIATGNMLIIHGTKVQFKTGERTIGSNPYVEATLDLQFLPNATDATAGGVSPLQITVANAVSAAYIGS